MRIVNKNKYRLLTQNDVFKSVLKNSIQQILKLKTGTDRKQKGSSHIQVDIIVYKSRVVQLSVSDQ